MTTDAAAIVPPVLGETVPLAAAGGRRYAQFLAYTLPELEAWFHAAPVEEVAAVLHEKGDLDLFGAEHVQPTLDRVMRARFTEQGRDDFIVAFRAHDRDSEATRLRVGRLQTVTSALVPAERWRSDLEEAQRRLSDALEQAKVAQQQWEDEVARVQPGFEAKYNAEVEALQARYDEAVARIQQENGIEQLRERFQAQLAVDVEASRQQHTKQLEAVLATVRAELGKDAMAVDRALVVHQRRLKDGILGDG